MTHANSNLKESLYKFDTFTDQQCRAIYNSKLNHVPSVTEYLSNSSSNISVETAMLLNTIREGHIECTKILLESGRFDESLFEYGSNFYQWLLTPDNDLFIRQIFEIDFVINNIQKEAMEDFIDWFDKDTENFINQFFETRLLKSKINEF